MAREQSQENPVYYVQYAHARVHGILARLDDVPAPGAAPPPDRLDPAERALVLRLADWPVAVAEAEERRAPHRVAAYLVDLARDFHALLPPLPGRGPGGAEVEAFRRDCCVAVSQTIRAGLGPARRGGPRAHVAHSAPRGTVAASRT